MRFKDALNYKRTRYKGEHRELMSRLYQPLSNIFLWFFLKIGISANGVSFGMFLCTVFGLFLMFYSLNTFVFGAVLLYIAQVWDYTDGDVARETKIFSNFGLLWDGLHHTFQELLMFPAAGFAATQILLTKGVSYYQLPLVLGIIISISFIVMQRLKFFVEHKLQVKDDRELRKGWIVLFYGEWIKLWIILIPVFYLFGVLDILIYIAFVWSIIRMPLIAAKLMLRCME